MEHKVCSRCDTGKPLTYFGPDKRQKSGLKSICKQCDVELHTIWLAAHKDDPNVKRWQTTHLKRSLARFKSKKQRGECYFCDRKAKPGQTRCAEHSRRACEKQKGYNRDRRERVIRAYGGVCACCGEKDFRFLTIDHINNDGANHRRSIVKSQKRSSAGTEFYIWLEREHFPSGFQVLCMNCNWGKRVNGGICPHKQK